MPSRNVKHLMMLAGFLLGLVINVNAATAPPELAQLDEKLRTGQPVTLAAIGDSITFVCYHTDSRRNYLTFVVDALRQAYPHANIKTVIAGNSHGLEDRLIRLQREVLPSHADLVFITFGMNDCGEGDKGLAVYDNGLTEMIHRTRAGGAIPVIVTQNEILYDAPGGNRRALPQYMARAVQVAQREKCLWVDNFTDWRDLERQEPNRWIQYLDDAIHPNLAGHRRFARQILDTLWPEAASFQYSGLRPPLPQAGIPPVACLLGGPPDKQILRINRDTWLALTGGRRGSEVTDLILWVCENNANPTWKDFRPITLSGPGSDALFDWGERTINSAVLLTGHGRLFIAFTPTVRVNLLSAEIPKEHVYQTLSNQQSYTAFPVSAWPIPTDAHSSYLGDCEILDAFADPNGYPAYLIRDLLLNAGAGVVYQGHKDVKSGTFDKTGNYATKLLLEGGTSARGAMDEANDLIAAGQHQTGSPLTALCGQHECPTLPADPVDSYSLSIIGNLPLLLYRSTAPGNAWEASLLTNNRWEPVTLPASARRSQSLAVLADGRNADLVQITGTKALILLLQNHSFRPWGRPTPVAGATDVRSEGRVPAGAQYTGLLWEDHGLHFATLPLPSQSEIQPH